MAGSWISGGVVDIGFSEDVSFEEQSDGRRGLSVGICGKKILQEEEMVSIKANFGINVEILASHSRLIT